MISYRTVLHFFHHRFVFRRFQVQKIYLFVLSYYNAVWIQIPVPSSVAASLKLIQTDADLPEPLKKNLLFHLRIIAQITDKQTSLYAVHALTAPGAVFNKLQNFIHLFHILFSSAAQMPADSRCRTRYGGYFPDSCENHQKLMVIKDFNQND